MATVALTSTTGNASVVTPSTQCVDGIVAKAVRRLSASSPEHFREDRGFIRLQAHAELHELRPRLSNLEFLRAYRRILGATRNPRTPEVAATLRTLAAPAPRVFAPEAWEYERFPLDLEREEATAMHADHLEWLASEQAAWAHLPNDPDDLTDLDVDDQVEDDDDSRLDWSDMIPPDGRGPRLAPLPDPDDDQTADLFAPTACLS
jgi:hypothetical protein